MSLARWLLGVAGAWLAGGTLFAALLGLLGAAWGWADAINNFAPVWLVLALAGGLFSLVGPASRIRRPALAAALVAVVAWAWPIGFEAVSATRERIAGPPTLTILSFNRWWDSPQPEQQRELAAIRNSGADLVALQEADNFVEAVRSLKDIYPYQFVGAPRSDAIILSRTPFLSEGGSAPHRVNFLWARVTARDGKPATLATTHLYWPIPPWRQRNQRAALVERTRLFPGEDFVLTGDFNLAPWTWAMRGLDRSIAPLSRRSHGLLTWPATSPLAFLALDEVFASPNWKTVSVRRLPYAGSDHYPMLIELRR